MPTKTRERAHRGLERDVEAEATGREEPFVTIPIPLVVEPEESVNSLPASYYRKADERLQLRPASEWSADRAADEPFARGEMPCGLPTPLIRDQSASTVPGCELWPLRGAA